MQSPHRHTRSVNCPQQQSHSEGLALIREVGLSEAKKAHDGIQRLMPALSGLYCLLLVTEGS